MKPRNSMFIFLLLVTLFGGQLFGQDHLSKAGKFFFMKDYRNAIKEYKLALQVKPNDGRIHYNIGACYEKLGNLREAVKSYQLALKYKPDLHEVKSALARINESDEIQADIQATAALRKANTAFLKKDYQTAISQYNKALAASPKNFQALYNVAFCYEQIGKFEMALQNYEQALAQKPQSKEAQTSFDRIQSKHSTNLYNTYRAQLDSLIDANYLVSAHRKANQILRLKPRDRWARKKLQFIQSQVEQQNQIQALTETQTPTAADSTDSTQTAAIEKPSPVQTEQAAPKKKNAESTGFPMYLMFILIGGVVVIIVLIVIMMMKRGGSDRYGLESEPASETTKPAVQPEPTEAPAPVKNLANKSVYDLIQDHYTSKKTGVLRIKGKAPDNHVIEGEVRMLNGNIVDSNSNEKQAVDALYQLLEVENITEITFQKMKVTDSGNIRQATLPLLMKWTLGMKKE